MLRNEAERIESGVENGAGVAVGECSAHVTPLDTVHQHVCREGGEPIDEQLFADWIVRFLYSTTRENAPWLFDAVTSPRMSRWLAYLNFDVPLTSRLVGQRAFLESCGVDLHECYDPPDRLDTPRKIFERRIRYWHCRPMPDDDNVVVSPADARILVGSLAADSRLYLKGKFFDLEELLAIEKLEWHDAFAGGDAAILRLTPDRYHYNHVPVSGVVLDFYEVDGACHASNPSAVVELATPYSKNRRVVTILDTDVPSGSNIGLVAMIEVVALMIGDVVQCYSETLYDEPLPVHRGMFLERGAPKSLFRPGSSTDVLLFQRDRIRFVADLIENRFHPTAISRFSSFGTPLVETDVRARSRIAERAEAGDGS